MLKEGIVARKSTRFSPPQVLALSFVSVIFIGSLLLYLPISTVSGHTDYIDCLFTATTSVCVTGLVTVDTGTNWSLFGHIVILLMIQIGGLGIMAFTTLFALILGSKIHLKQRLIMQQAVNVSSLGGVVKVTRYLLFFTLTCETLGAIILTLHWWPEMGLGKAAWFGMFHSVSAFNNAGIDLFGYFRSITAYTGDITVNLVISSLIILGGLGFYVSYELFTYRRQRKLSLHSKTVLLTTVILIVGGTLVLLAIEWNHALKDMPYLTRFLAAYFQAVTPRTAGFNSIDISTLHLASKFFIVLLMFIGASPGSTGGGIKTSTLAIVCSAMWSQIRGRKDCEIIGRRLEPEDVMQAMTIITVYGGVMFLSSFLLSLTHPGDLMEVVFEVGSALGTVGLSLGLTTQLTLWGKIIIITTMFLGRVGPVTLGFALAYQKKSSDYRYPKGKIMLG